jgi:choloylglycine hydrolase
MCTNFKLPTAQDGTVCVGRTMEFPDVLPWQLSVIASDAEGDSVVNDHGKRWTATHGIVGISAFEPNWLGDGVNTAGLSGHTLYMPDHAVYAEPRLDGSDISILEALAYVLGTCATVDEARAALATINVVNFTSAEIPMALPVHFVFHDRASCIVAEFHPDGMLVSDNPVQVATNAPYLDWHLTNVANYLSLSSSNPDPVNIGGRTFAPSGQGQGFRGLPADENSPSRFLRALAQVHFAQPPKDDQAAAMDTIRLLHGFDVVPGTVMEQTPSGLMPLLTMWSTVSDLTGGRYLYNTIDDPVWYSIDLDSTDFSTTRTSAFQTDGDFTSVSL